MQFYADREFPDDLVQSGIEIGAGGDDVATFEVGNRDADCRGTVKTHQVDCWLQIAGSYLHEVLECDDILATLGGPGLVISQVQWCIEHLVENTGTDTQFTDVLWPVELPRRRYAQASVTDLDRTAIDDLVLQGQGRDEILGRNAKFGQPLFRGIEIDDLWLQSPSLDPGNAGHQPEFLLDRFDVGFQFGIGKPLARHGQNEPVDETEIVHDVGCQCPGRQEMMDIAHLAAHLIPHLW